MVNRWIWRDRYAMTSRYGRCSLWQVSLIQSVVTGFRPMSFFYRIRNLFRKDAPQSFGDRGEVAARRYLQKRGMKVLSIQDRNSFGELDIVAVDGKTIVFVEVKTRANHNAGHPTEAVGPAKQKKITGLALAYMKRHGLLETPARFDVVGVTWPVGQNTPEIDHIRNAFEAVGRGQMYS